MPSIVPLSAAPIASVFWLVGRHLAETDEYTRKVRTDDLLLGGGIALSLAMLVGFLEIYRVVPPMEHVSTTMLVTPLFFFAWLLVHVVRTKRGG